MGRPFKVNIDTRSIKDAIGDFDQYDQNQQRRIGDQIEKSTTNIKHGVLRRVPRRSGAMARKVRETFNRAKLSGKVSIKSPAAHLVEFGARAVTEYPKNRKALRIDALGVRRFAVKANIPARKPRPMLRPAFEDEKPNLLDGIKGAASNP